MLRKLLLIFNFYNFLRIKILPLEQIDNYLPKKGKIIELGCGDGFISNYLSSIKTRSVTGIDNDRKRLPKSAKTNLKFIHGDIRNYSVNSFDGIIISDVLHHLNYKDQKNLLSKIAKSLKRNGVFLIKEIDTSEFLRSKFSRLWDYVFYPRDKIYYHNSNELKEYLESLGFQTNITWPCRLVPASTALFLCKKR